MHVCQIDNRRVAGVSGSLAILLMAAKFGVPVGPHAGGVGLCEHLQHLAMFACLAVSCSLENRVIEYVDHLHEQSRHPVTARRGRYAMPQTRATAQRCLQRPLKPTAFQKVTFGPNFASRLSSSTLRRSVLTAEKTQQASAVRKDFEHGQLEVPTFQGHCALELPRRILHGKVTRIRSGESRVILIDKTPPLHLKEWRPVGLVSDCLETTRWSPDP